MAEHPLYVAIVWHMHQPFYRDLRTGEIALPWVRLHAAKDYLHMAEVLAAFPNVHLTINMVPSLTDQMLAWSLGQEQDRLAGLAVQAQWTVDERRYILNLAYSVNWDNIIRRYPRYAELLDRRPQALANPDAFSTQDYRDLLAWFNLAWIDPNWLERDQILARLVAKGRDFTTADARLIHDKQREIAARVLPLYRQLAARGQLEISATPYYHPILPLLIDTGAARRASPGLPLPTLNLRAAEDAAGQLQAAVLAHTRHFGGSPRGLWPSEGAVSFELLPLVSAAGFQWLASDEAILARSLGRSLVRDGSGLATEPHWLYRAYRVLTDGNVGPWMIFRDHELSDRIGFLYQRLPGRQAAEDMIYRLIEIRNRLNDPGSPYLVSIILDGENCWEHYEHNGDVFLRAFYELLSQRSELKAVTVSEYLAHHQTGGGLARLATGSWIGGDLTTWIGDPEHNRAWEALARTRAHLLQAESAATDAPAQAGQAQPELSPEADPARHVRRPEEATSSQEADEPAPDNPQQPVRPDMKLAPGAHAGTAAARERFKAAWQALYAAEGSDWFWWYSHRNRSDQDAIFDRLFRDDLAAVYEILGDVAPGWLDRPIGQAPVEAGGHAAAGYIAPPLTAAPYPGDEWSLAAALQPAGASSGTMQRADIPIERLFLGHDQRSLYLRLDLRDRIADYTVAIYLSCAGCATANQRTRAHTPEANPGGLVLGWEIELQSGQSVPFLFRAAGHDQWQGIGPLAAAVGAQVLEVAVPMAELDLAVGRDVSVLVTLAQHGDLKAALPERGMADFTLREFGQK